MDNIIGLTNECPVGHVQTGHFHTIHNDPSASYLAGREDNLSVDATEGGIINHRLRRQDSSVDLNFHIGVYRFDRVNARLTFGRQRFLKSFHLQHNVFVLFLKLLSGLNKLLPHREAIRSCIT